MHEHIFGVLAYYLDTQHRPLDGAFIASLIGDQGPDELLQKGKARLRRVPWQNLTLDVLKSNQSTNTDVQTLSEPCDMSEIDYFISHSWSDDPAEKYAALQEVSEGFYEHHWRYPTFWLDKVPLLTT